jgi:hypothetical protein
MDSTMDGRGFQMGFDGLVDPDQLSMTLQIVDALFQAGITHEVMPTVGVRGVRGSPR